jgi:hypothetical protein
LLSLLLGNIVQAALLGNSPTSRLSRGLAAVVPMTLSH